MKLKHLPTLVVGIALYGLVMYILTNTPPSAIEDILFANSYLPLLVSFFAANLFVFAFLWGNTRRGALTSLSLTLLLWFHLQQLLTGGVAVFIFGSVAILELGLSWAERK